MRRRCRSERGATFVEMAMVAPVLFLLAMGIFEFGLAWRDAMTVGTATRAGARVASNMGVDPYADHAALASLGSALGNVGLENVEWVVIYRADSADGIVPEVCTTSGAVAAGGVSSAGCNTYDAADIQDVVDDPVGSRSSYDDPGCSGDKDAAWCPTSRQNLQSLGDGPDYIGVAVRARVDFVTGAFGDGLSVTKHTVMRLEPVSAFVG